MPPSKTGLDAAEWINRLAVSDENSKFSKIPLDALEATFNIRY